MTDVESYTTAELDQLGGALLYVGRVHSSVASLLDTTAYQSDLRLIEYLNFAPTSLVLELLPDTGLLLTEAKTRLEQLERAVSAAMDNCAERIASGTDETSQAFDNIMTVEFGEDRKKNGG